MSQANVYTLVIMAVKLTAVMNTETAKPTFREEMTNSARDPIAGLLVATQVVDWSVLMSTGARYSMDAEGLKIRNITQRDDGEYTCRAEVIDDGRYDEKRITVAVHSQSPSYT